LFFRDHSTVLHARNKIAKLRKTDEKLNSEIGALIARLGVAEAA
jgi:chromosomal replication initiation ATPase DnaA